MTKLLKQWWKDLILVNTNKIFDNKVEKVKEVEKMVRQEDPKVNLLKEYHGATLSDKVACNCDPEEAKKLRKQIGESFKMGSDHESSSTYVVPSPKYSRVKEFMMFELIFF